MYRFRWPAVAAVLCVCVVGTFIAFRGSEDPRVVFARTAAPLCAAQVSAVGAMPVPDPADPAATAATGSAIAATLDDLAAAVSNLEVPDGAEPIAEALEAEAAGRADTYRAAVGPETAEKLAASIDRVAGAFEGVDPGECATLAFPGSAEVERVTELLGSATDACSTAAADFTAADAAVSTGDLSFDGYIGQVGDVAGQLVRELTPLAPDDGAWAPLLDPLGEFPTTIGVGDLEGARTQSRAWAAAARELGLPGCDTGVSPDLAAPSGIIDVPAPAGIAPVGVTGGEVIDAPAFADLLAQVFVSSSGTSPDAHFGAPALLSHLGVSAVTGDGPPTAGTAAVAEPVPANPSQKVWERNPYQMHIAVLDTSGRCATVLVSGADRPVATQVVDSNEACTAAR